MNAQRSAARQKRGGEAHVLSMDFTTAEAELTMLPAAGVSDPDELFRREWVRSVFETAIARLRDDLVAKQKAVHFELFARYDLQPLDVDDRPTYAELARALELPPTQVTNYLALARRRFREIVLDLLAETTGNDRDYADSVRELLGIGVES
jgi:hypothetical protein